MKEKPGPNERLRNERERRGWSREYVAEKIEGDPRTIGRWERGTTSPSPYYRQALCELFGMNAEELGFFKEAPKDIPELHMDRPQEQGQAINMVANQSWSPPPAQRSSQLALGYRGLLGLIAAAGIVMLIAVLIISFLFSRLLLPSLSVAMHIRPGGLWVNPADRQIVHGIIHFAAHAYPTNPGDPAINHVNFTAGWNGGGAWKVACIAYPPADKDIFACDADLSRFDAPAGRIKVSFDVYDQVGNVNFAPNGVHTIVYGP